MKTISVLCLLSILVIGISANDTDSQYKLKDLRKRLGKLENQIKRRLDNGGVDTSVEYLQENVYKALRISEGLVNAGTVTIHTAVRMIMHALTAGLEAVTYNSQYKAWIQGFCDEKRLPFDKDTRRVDSWKQLRRTINNRVPTLCWYVLKPWEDE